MATELPVWSCDEHDEEDEEDQGDYTTGNEPEVVHSGAEVRIEAAERVLESCDAEAIVGGGTWVQGW